MRKGEGKKGEGMRKRKGIKKSEGMRKGEGKKGEGMRKGEG